MALADTISAIECVPICDTTRSMSDAQFYAFMVDRMSDVLSLDLDDITAAQINTAVTTALCSLEDRSAFPAVSPDKYKSLLIFLALSM